LNRKKVLTGVLAVFLAALFGLSAVMAATTAWYVESSTINKISIGSVSAGVVEEFEQNQEYMPGAEVQKVVQVKNTGGADVLVRVKIDSLWGDINEQGEFVQDTSLDSEKIIIKCDTDNWYYSSEDGYWYYRGILAPGELAPPLFEVFFLDEEMGHEYAKKHGRIVVHMECVLAVEGALEYWNGGVSEEDLGIEYLPDPDINMVTTVDFISPEKGFEFTVNGGDLFANFKNLTPGESRSQDFTVSNKWTEPVRIFMWSDVVDRDELSAEELELLDDLLKKYCRIIITDENGKIIYEGPIYTLSVNGEGDYKLDLGRFDPGQVKKYHISLQLDSAMDNRGLYLLGLIRWYFSAQGVEDEDTTEPTTTPSEQTTVPSTVQDVVPPATGDETKLLIWTELLIGSGTGLIALLVYVILQKRKERQAEADKA
jgi:hypothetical protein